MGLDGKKHRRNLNTLVIGGSGAGKTRFYAKPNILQCNTSFVVLDPKGEIIRSVGHLLEDEGYDIKVSKIASGVPIGAEIEYIDPMTLEMALEERKYLS